MTLRNSIFSRRRRVRLNTRDERGIAMMALLGIIVVIAIAGLYFNVFAQGTATQRVSNDGHTYSFTFDAGAVEKKVSTRDVLEGKDPEGSETIVVLFTESETSAECTESGGVKELGEITYGGSSYSVCEEGSIVAVRFLEGSEWHQLGVFQKDLSSPVSLETIAALMNDLVIE